MGKEGVSHYLESDRYFGRVPDLPANVFFHDQLLSIWHDHHFYEFVFVISGDGYNKTMTRKTRISQGSMIFVFPGEAHCYQVETEPLILINLLIKPSFFNDKFLPGEILADLRRYHQVVHLAPESKDYQRLFNCLYSMIEECEKDRRYRKHMFTALLCEVLCEASRHFSAQETDHKHREYRDTICEYVNRTDSEPSIEEIADLTGMKLSYIARNFKNITGYNFVEFVNEFRVKKVCDMLTRNVDTIDQVFRHSGYSSKVHFNRAFKQAMGMTPLQYRKQAHQRQKTQTKSAKVLVVQ